MIPGWVHTKYKFLKFIIDGERRRPVIHFNNNNQEEELNYWAHKELERERDGRPALFLSGVWWRFVLYLNSEMFVCLFVCYISYGLPGVAHELDQRVFFFFIYIIFLIEKENYFLGESLVRWTPCFVLSLIWFGCLLFTIISISSISVLTDSLKGHSFGRASIFIFIILFSLKL